MNEMIVTVAPNKLSDEQEFGAGEDTSVGGHGEAIKISKSQ